MLIIVLSQDRNLIVFDPLHLILLDMSWRGWEKKRSGSHGIKTTIHDLLSVSENATCLVKWHTSATLTNDHTLLSIGHIFSKANTHSSYAFCCIIRITPKTKGRWPMVEDKRGRQIVSDNLDDQWCETEEDNEKLVEWHVGGEKLPNWLHYQWPVMWWQYVYW